jgi:mRNA-degrading endonuclease YafQ of YafQ-DinJ toxin-antitoxin module
VKIFKEIIPLPEFEKDLKTLLKRFRTLKDDLDNFIKTGLNLYHKLGIDNKGVFQIPGLPFHNPKVFKAKKFACRALRGRGIQSGIRVIYSYFEKEDKIELIEIYYKGDKANENRERILRYYEKGEN